MQKGFLAAFVSDVVLVTSSYALCVYLKPGTSSHYFSNYAGSFVLFIFIWIITSFLFEKYNLRLASSWWAMFRKIITVNLFIFFVITSMMYLLQSFNYSRFIVIGTVGIISVAEMILASMYYMFSDRVVSYETDADDFNMVQVKDQEVSDLQVPKKRKIEYDFYLRDEYLKNKVGNEAYLFLQHYIALDSQNTLVASTTTSFNIDAQLQRQFQCIINIRRVNDFRYINKFFESVNLKLPVGGIYADFLETKNLRKARILQKFPSGFNYLYYSLDFILKRVFPKFTLTKKIYFLLTRGENRVLSKAEAFGRLYSCGFEILDEKIIDKNLYFIAIKVKDPLYPKNPSYGSVITLERIGKGGKTIKVYKMRTMHPFAEYLQDYIYKKAGLQEGGKFKNDFRITTLGKFMRALWIDELPMLINLLKGDLKLVGVRPLSRQYYKLYTRELQRLRVLTKPGLIPPFYVDHPKTLDEIITSELKYLRAYYRHPLITDWKYFWKAIFNIIFKRYRSK
jgi:lipopolysaccharide/colanic/teichoic acid biosynthesis glycosyltransferase